MGTPRLDGTILFTAFEPSGDAHAAPVIEAIRAARPDVRICAWGGSQMALAGAELLGNTAEDGTMGLHALAKVKSVRHTVQEIDAWAASTEVAVHVPVDSPAANFPLCKRLRARGTRTVHFVAPQLWAWAPWRIHKLRARTDHVLCLLPFEEEWFRSRGVPATFVGHPAMTRVIDEQHLAEVASEFPCERPRLAIFPGSRTQEVARNITLLLATYRDLKRRHPGMTAVAVAARRELREQIESHRTKDDRDLVVQTGQADAAVWWCDVALTVSGTMSLNIARQSRPMVGVYCVSRLSMAIARAVLTTPNRLLPNVIAQKRIVPEFVPYSGGPEPIVQAVDALLTDASRRERQKAELDQLRSTFRGYEPGEGAAEVILQQFDAVNSAQEHSNIEVA